MTAACVVHLHLLDGGTAPAFLAGLGVGFFGCVGLFAWVGSRL